MSDANKSSFYTVGILVVSDTCARNEATDTSGVNLKEILSQKEYQVEKYDIVPDNIDAIKDKLIEWSDKLNLNLILTTGGTGLASSDVTPEATKSVLHREIPSIPNTILYESLKITKFAMLSRAIAGTRSKTLIINLPGSKKASMECLTIILPVLPHSLALICDKKVEVKADHVVIQSTGEAAPRDSHHKCSHHSHDHHSKSSVTDAYMLSKPRQSIYPMIPMNDAIKMVLDHSNAIDIETRNFMDALSYISAENIYAKVPLPHFRASVKDGFALKLPKDYKPNTDLSLKVIGTSNAGDTVNLHLNEGECVKINTGAFVPSNADAVIQIEDTVSTGKNDLGEDTGIKISNSNISIGNDIRDIGSDIAVGEIVVKKNTEIGAAQIGICATVGVLNLRVFKKPIVGIISTGNELVSPSTETLCEGKIRDSNKSLLLNACKQVGIQAVIDAGIAKDNSDSVLETFKAAMDKTDVIISTGGVSMGDKDLVKDVLVKDLKCELHFARLNMKPGKPTTFATVNYNGKK